MEVENQVLNREWQTGVVGNADCIGNDIGIWNIFAKSPYWNVTFVKDYLWQICSIAETLLCNINPGRII